MSGHGLSTATLGKGPLNAITSVTRRKRVREEVRSYLLPELPGVWIVPGQCTWSRGWFAFARGGEKNDPRGPGSASEADGMFHDTLARKDREVVENDEVPYIQLFLHLVLDRPFEAKREIYISSCKSEYLWTRCRAPP